MLFVLHHIVRSFEIDASIERGPCSDQPGVFREILDPVSSVLRMDASARILSRDHRSSNLRILETVMLARSKHHSSDYIF